MTNPGLLGAGGVLAPSQPLPQSPTAVALAGALGTAFAAPAAGSIDGSRAVFVGDSLTLGDSTGSIAQFDSYALQLSRASAGQIRTAFNAGHGGWTSTMLLRMLDAEVWSKNPSVVFFLPGRNDALEGDSIPRDTLAYLDAVRAGCAARGIPLILVGQVPNGLLALGTPAAPTVTASSSGGTLPAGTYGYKTSWVTGAGGETLPSPAASATVSGSSSSVRIDFPVSTAAAQYKVYRETTAGSGTYALLATTSVGSLGNRAAKSYLDTGAVTPSGNPASSDGTAISINPTTGRMQAAVSLALSIYARRWGLLFADPANALVDPATGNYQAGLSEDGTHCSPKGKRVMGDSLWAQIGRYFRPSTLAVPHSNIDYANKIGNGLLLTGTGSPTGWTNTASSGSGITTPTLAPVTGFRGNGFTIGITDGVSSTEWTSPVSTAAIGDTKTAMNQGDVLEWSCRVAVSGADAGGGSFLVKVADDYGNNVYAGYATDANGIISGTFTNSISTSTNYKFVFSVRNGPIVATIGELCIVNLTRTKNA